MRELCRGDAISVGPLPALGNSVAGSESLPACHHVVRMSQGVWEMGLKGLLRLSLAHSSETGGHTYAFLACTPLLVWTLHFSGTQGQIQPWNSPVKSPIAFPPSF